MTVIHVLCVTPVSQKCETAAHAVQHLLLQHVDVDEHATSPSDTAMDNVSCSFPELLALPRYLISSHLFPRLSISMTTLTRLTPYRTALLASRLC